MFIQETKIQEMIKEIFEGIWGNQSMGWSVKGAVGQSGGILIVWKLGLVNLNTFLRAEVSLELMQNGKRSTFILSVFTHHATQWIRQPMGSFGEFKKTKLSMGNEWQGNFNVVKCVTEKFGKIAYMMNKWWSLVISLIK